MEEKMERECLNIISSDRVDLMEGEGEGEEEGREEEEEEEEKE